MAESQLTGAEAGALMSAVVTADMPANTTQQVSLGQSSTANPNTVPQVSHGQASTGTASKGTTGAVPKSTRKQEKKAKRRAEKLAARLATPPAGNLEAAPAAQSGKGKSALNSVPPAGDGAGAAPGAAVAPAATPARTAGASEAPAPALTRTQHRARARLAKRERERVARPEAQVNAAPKAKAESTAKPPIATEEISIWFGTTPMPPWISSPSSGYYQRKHPRNSRAADTLVVEGTGQQDASILHIFDAQKRPYRLFEANKCEAFDVAYWMGSGVIDSTDLFNLAPTLGKGEVVRTDKKKGPNGMVPTGFQSDPSVSLPAQVSDGQNTQRPNTSTTPLSSCTESVQALIESWEEESSQLEHTDTVVIQHGPGKLRTLAGYGCAIAAATCLVSGASQLIMEGELLAEAVQQGLALGISLASWTVKPLLTRASGLSTPPIQPLQVPAPRQPMGVGAMPVMSNTQSVLSSCWQSLVSSTKRATQVVGLSTTRTLDNLTKDIPMEKVSYQTGYGANVGSLEDTIWDAPMTVAPNLSQISGIRPAGTELELHRDWYPTDLHSDHFKSAGTSIPQTTRVTNVLGGLARLGAAAMLFAAATWCWYGAGAAGEIKVVVDTRLRTDLKPWVTRLLNFKVRNMDTLEVATARAFQLADKINTDKKYDISNQMVTDTVIVCVEECINISDAEKLVGARLTESRAGQWAQFDLRQGIVGWWGWLFYTPWSHHDRFGKLPTRRF